VVVDQVVAIDRDRPELARDRGFRAGAEPEPCALELGEVAAQQQGIKRDRGRDDGLGHDALAVARRAAAVVVVLDADRAAVDERGRVAVVPGARGIPVAVAPGLVAESHVLVDVGGRRVPRAAAAGADAEVGRGRTSVGRGERGVGRAKGADHAVMDERDERCRVTGRELG
jgi:hypothetical protein